MPGPKAAEPAPRSPTPRPTAGRRRPGRAGSGGPLDRPEAPDGPGPGARRLAPVRVAGDQGPLRRAEVREGGRAGRPRQDLPQRRDLEEALGREGRVRRQGPNPSVIKSVLTLYALDATIFDYGPERELRGDRPGAGQDRGRPGRNASVIHTAFWEDEMKLADLAGRPGRPRPPPRPRPRPAPTAAGQGDPPPPGHAHRRLQAHRPRRADHPRRPAVDRRRVRGGPQARPARRRRRDADQVAPGRSRTST